MNHHQVAAARVAALTELEQKGEDEALLFRFPPPQTYALRVVRDEGATVRELPEPVGGGGNRLLRVLDPGTVVEASERRITATGAWAEWCHVVSCRVVCGAVRA